MTRSNFFKIMVVGLLIPVFLPGIASSQEEKANDQAKGENATLAIKRSVEQLLKIQEEDGAWPYEGVYRVRRQIPVGYRVGGTAIVCTSLLYSPNEDQKAVDAAIEKATGLILKELEHPLMRVSVEDRYDVRVWGHMYALDYFCRLSKIERFKELNRKTRPWIQKLVNILVEEEIKGGGWNYASQRAHAAFVTAPAIQSLLWARSVGAKVPDEIFERGVDVLQKSRTEKGAYQYSGTLGGRRGPAKLPGSIARSANCESTLILLGKGNQKDLQHSIDAFHEHWIELEKRRKKTGTHKPPYNVAPYYFYYGHRYLAQSIQFLPENQRQAEQEKFEKVLLKTRDADHTWNDRVFDRSRAFGTAMAILALQTDVPLPPRYQSKKARQ